MTIGIAAHGPNAGMAVLKALAAVEAVGRGAIGGFVSLVVLTEAGAIEQVAVQRGGSAALFGAPLSEMPPIFAEATIAGLMSSGPDRPEPLSQFTPAAAGIGLVTGHRMPNTIGVSGMRVNGEVLDLLKSGMTPRDAIDQVLGDNPDLDAGIIAVAVDGAIHAANTPYVAQRGDGGQAVIVLKDRDMSIAVLHNAIHPHQPLAQLAAHVALDAMRPEDRSDGTVSFTAGTPLVFGAANAINIDSEGMVRQIRVSDPKFLSGSWSLGIGHKTPILRDADAVGMVLYEPYMFVEDGVLQTVDGKSVLVVPVKWT